MMSKDTSPVREMLPPGVRRLFVDAEKTMFMSEFFRSLNAQLQPGEKMFARIDNLEQPGYWDAVLVTIDGKLCMLVDNEATLESIIIRYGRGRGLFIALFAVKPQPNLL